MKILIVTEGGKDVGFGHVARCAALCDAFKETGERPYLVVNGDTTLKPLLREEQYKILDWIEDESELLDMISCRDMVIIDSYMASGGLLERIASRAGLAAYLDDNNRVKYKNGIVINGAVNASDLKYPKTKGVIYLMGAKFALLRKEFRRFQCRRIRKKVRAAMIAFGGNDSKDMTLEILNLFIAKYQRLTKRVVIGNGFSNIGRIKNIKARNVEPVLAPDAKRMKEIMLKSDIAISAGGQTMLEMARLGLPVIVIRTADNQANNIQGLREAGAIEYAGRWDDTGILTKVERCMEKLKRAGARRLISRRSAFLVDGEGAVRVAKFLLKEASN